MVDPMDGTKEFIAHIGEFAVMIGLAIDGAARLGVVYQPVNSELYYAASGQGAFYEHEGARTELRVSEESDPARMTLAVSRSHPSRTVDHIRELLGVEQTIRSGSIGLKVGLVCRRRADLYLYTAPYTFQWDSCAPEAILAEAGGRMTDLGDNPLVYNRPELRNANGVIASNGRIHSRISAAAQAVLKR
jgi:3'(2'), 5'-bisphosphate nucleotidase